MFFASLFGMARAAVPYSELLTYLKRASPIFLSFLFAALMVGLYYSRALILSSLIGIGLGVLISPTVRWLHRNTRLPRGVYAGLFVLLFLTSFAGVFYLVGHMATQQIVPLTERLPETFESMKQEVSGFLNGQGISLPGLEQANLSSIMAGALGGIFQSIQVTTMALGLLIYIVALSAYLSVSPERYQNSFLSIFPAYRREKVRSVLDDSAKSLRQWFLAQLVSMFFVGVVTATALWIIGVEQWFTIGFIAFVLEFIPYLGPIFGGILAVMITLVSNPSLTLWVLGAVLVIQQLESNVITPMVLKKGVDLSPVHLLILAAIFGAWFGILGVFMAAPTLTVAKVIYQRTYGENMDQMHLPQPDPAEAAAAEAAGAEAEPRASEKPGRNSAA